MQLLHQIYSLRPVVDNYGPRRLFKLEGTIPIQHRSNQYSIPIALWLAHDFPLSPPICYVIPTANMKIKREHKYVCSSGVRTGRIYHPYIASWQASESTLAVLVGLLCSAFGAAPPLYNLKQSNRPNANVNARHHSASNPVLSEWRKDVNYIAAFLKDSVALDAIWQRFDKNGDVK